MVDLEPPMTPPASGALGWATAIASRPVEDVLAGNRIVRTIEHAAEVTSTQDLLRERAIAGAAPGTVLVTDRQRAGRGRSGHRWDDDPDGGSLALSLLLEVGAAPIDTRTAVLVPHALGLAVVETCAVLAADPGALRLKWPNDVVHRASGRSARKVAGVLVEREVVAAPAGSRDVLVGGIGVNLTLGADAPLERTDLATVLGAPPDRAVLLAALLMTLDVVLRALTTPATLLERCRRASDTLGRDVRVLVPGRPALVGRATGIDDEGRLLVHADGTTHVVLSGTVRDAEVPDDGSAR